MEIRNFMGLALIPQAGVAIGWHSWVSVCSRLRQET